MIAKQDVIDALEEQILAELTRGKYQPGQKLLSERELAKRLGSTPSRTHRAIGRLVEKGYLRTRHGDGTYLERPPEASSSKLKTPSIFEDMETLFCAPNRHRLRVSVPVGDDAAQRKAWELLAQNFIRTDGRFDVEYDFNLESNECDLAVVACVHLRKRAKEFRPLGDMAEKAGLVSGAASLGEVDQTQLGLPIFWTTMVVTAHSGVLGSHQFGEKDISAPVDIFRVGAELERQSGGKTLGVFYWNILLHAAHAGVRFVRKGNRISFDRNRLAELFEQMGPHMRAHHFGPRRWEPERCFSGLYGFVPHILSKSYIDNWPELALMRLPLAPGGFTMGGMFLGCVPHTCHCPEKAMAFLRHCTEDEPQRLVTGALPSYLSVKPEPLKAQKKASPYPPGSVQYEFDARSFYPQVDLEIYGSFSEKAMLHSERYFLGKQSLGETMESLLSI